jgi:hypothetical protein
VVGNVLVVDLRGEASASLARTPALAKRVLDELAGTLLGEREWGRGAGRGKERHPPHGE